MELKSVREKAEEWGITPRRVQILCGEGRVEGAVRVGRAWVIPDDEKKPDDARIKSGKYIKSNQ